MIGDYLWSDLNVFIDMTSIGRISIEMSRFSSRKKNRNQSKIPIDQWISQSIGAIPRVGHLWQEKLTAHKLTEWNETFDVNKIQQQNHLESKRLAANIR